MAQRLPVKRVVMSLIIPSTKQTNKKTSENRKAVVKIKIVIEKIITAIKM